MQGYTIHPPPPPQSMLEFDVVVLYFSCSKGIMCATLCSSFLVTHSVGRRMVYPGSVMLLQKAMWPMLLQGQAKLVEEVETTDALLEFASLGTMEFADGDPSTFSQYDGQRNKLLACDGNQIDTMFVDRRRVGGANGQTLVKTCNRGLCECCSYQSRWDFF